MLAAFLLGGDGPAVIGEQSRLAPSPWPFGRGTQQSTWTRPCRRTAAKAVWKNLLVTLDKR